MRNSVSSKRLARPVTLMNCFGNAFRLNGQSRVPEPPHNMTGHKWRGFAAMSFNTALPVMIGGQRLREFAA